MTVEVRERLGGLLSYYHRRAAWPRQHRSCFRTLRDRDVTSNRIGF
jgi:hypothetical protein